MMHTLLTTVSFVLLMALVLGNPLSVPSIDKLGNAFKEEDQVEATVLCLEGKKECTPEERYIRDRVMVIQRNHGICPTHLCDFEERARLSHAMNLLLIQYPNTLRRLIQLYEGQAIRAQPLDV